MYVSTSTGASEEALHPIDRCKSVVCLADIDAFEFVFVFPSVQRFAIHDAQCWDGSIRSAALKGKTAWEWCKLEGITK